MVLIKCRETAYSTYLLSHRACKLSAVFVCFVGSKISDTGSLSTSRSHRGFSRDNPSCQNESIQAIPTIPTSARTNARNGAFSPPFVITIGSTDMSISFNSERPIAHAPSHKVGCAS